MKWLLSFPAEVYMIGSYLVMAGISAYERQTGKTLYWVGCVILTLGILKMRG